MPKTNRRTLLKLAATALLPGYQLAQGASTPRVVVAGAGIVGASIAYHLANSGAAVTVIDRQGPATHASRGTFAWINATWAKQPQHYHRLNQDSVAYWRTLDQPLSLNVRWGGSIEWFDRAARQSQLVAQIAEQAAWGESAKMLDHAQTQRLEPNLMINQSVRAAFSANDGAVDPVYATNQLLRAANALGGTALYPCELLDATYQAGQLVAVETSRGSIPCDQLILATGAAPDLCRRIALADVPQRSTPGVIALTRPIPRLTHHVIAAPGVHLHQRQDGRVVLGEQDGAPQTTAHQQRLSHRPNNFPNALVGQQHGMRMLDVARRFVPKLNQANIETAYIGWRPLPIDGHPVLGRSPKRPDIYLAIMHSGVTLAPWVGHLVARELMDVAAVDQLAPYRPTRRFSQVRRY